MNIEIKNSGHVVLSDGNWRRCIDPHNQADLDLYADQLTQVELGEIAAKWIVIPIPTGPISPSALAVWKDSMLMEDTTCPRWFEDYITENSIVLAPGRAKDNYDVKVALRATKPGA